MLRRLGDLGDGERRRVRREDRVRPREPVELREELALRLELLDDRLDHEIAPGEVVDLGRQRQAGERRVSLLRVRRCFSTRAAQVALDRRAARSASSSVTSRPTVSWPAVTLICAIRRPSFRVPTTPTFTAAIYGRKPGPRVLLA